MKLRRTTRGILMGLTMLLLWAGIGGTAAGAGPDEPVAIKGYDTVALVARHDLVLPVQGEPGPFHGKSGELRPAVRRLVCLGHDRVAEAVTDPEVWTIVEGKLYLNCSPAAYEKWSRDIPGHIRKADEIWRKMQDEK